MAQIRLLDQATINKIAAGEVVERPASLVKELVENSIDAGASRVTVEIRDGGMSLVRVTDNGCGIEEDQIRTAFLRHSTSKIRSVDDLFSSTTLGFRGEALASIAAVARVEMTTRPEKQPTGRRYVIEGGVEQTLEEIACPAGTTIKVENLFFNTPARRKFLKKPASEAAAVTDLMQKIVLGHPEVAVDYINGGRGSVLISSGNGSLKQDIFAVYGRETVDKMIPAQGSIQLEGGGCMKVEGFISRPQFMKATRTYENYFINGRFIHSPLLEKAADEAYKDYVVPGTYPVVVLHLSMDPDALDVNVHPQKLEVRFFQEENVRRGLYEVLSEALSSQNLISRVGDFYKVPRKPGGAEKKEASAEPDFFIALPKTVGIVTRENPDETPYGRTLPYITGVRGQNEDRSGARKVPKGAVKAADLFSSWQAPAQKPVLKAQEYVEEAEEGAGEPETQGQGKAPAPAGETKIAFEQMETADLPDAGFTPQEETSSAPAPKPHQLRLVGQVFRTYWIAEENDIFYLVDQHAAHERVYYDKYRRMLRENTMDTQELMEPIVLHCNPRVTSDFDKYEPVLRQLGYEAEPFGEDAVIIRGVPFLFGKALPAEDLTRMMDMLYEGSVDTARDVLIDKIATMSCKAAVKGNDALTFEEARSLLSQLFACENPYNCPHGRPTMISVTQYELEKRFKRV